MRKSMKNILGVGALLLISSGVAGYTAYKVAGSEQTTSFTSLFQQNDKNLQYASYSAAEMQPVDLTQAAESSVHAVVHIRSKKLVSQNYGQGGGMPDDIFEFFFGQPSRRQAEPRPEVGFGSGVIISKDGYIVTNNHVVEGADEITVKLNDDREFKGRIIGTDPATDLALIKIQGNDFPTIPVGNSDDLKLGEWVLAVGNPFNLNSTVTAGIVSAKARAIGATAQNGQPASIQSFIQTDAAINRGNSGGALVNVKGELVGINAMLYSPTGAYSGYGFAIPTSIMVKVVSDLKQYGEVQRALLGIKGGNIGTDLQMDEKTAQEVKNKAKELGVTEGVFVAEVVDGGSAAGILKENDVIVGLNGTKVHKFADLQQVLAKLRPGDKVKVTIVRDKKKKDVTLTLKNAQGTTKVIKEAGMDVLGAAFKPLSAELKRQLNVGYGLQVTGVSGGKMAESGIRKGFIILKANGQPINSVDDLNDVLKAANQTPEQVLFISGMFPSGKRANYAVDLSAE